MRHVFCLFLLLLWLSGIGEAQAPAFVPEVNPDMIEISFDGVTFTDASIYVSDILISTGAAAGNHIYHARRGTVIHWEGQLGTPYETEKVEWKLDTGLILPGENRFYMRFCFGVEDPVASGTYITSTMSDTSDIVKLIGRPDKPRRDG